MIYLLFLIPFVFATELPTGDSAASQSNSQQTCVSDSASIQGIMDHQSAHRKDAHSSTTSPHPRYGAYRQSLRRSSGPDILTRLIYAETQEARCNELNPTVFPLVTEAILNRLEKRFQTLFASEYGSIQELPYQKQKELVESVVFQKSQFASSLHRYRTSGDGVQPALYSEGYLHFLCPKNDSTWKEARAIADEFFRSGNRPRKYSSTTVNYYLFKHAPQRWPNPPAWTSSLTEPTLDQTAQVRECIRLYEEPAYR